MPTWFGPTDTGPALTGNTPAGSALFAHYQPITRGLNLYILSDGTVTDFDPVGGDGWAGVVHALWGGHTEPITDDEATLLTNAGYGAFIT